MNRQSSCFSITPIFASYDGQALLIIHSHITHLLITPLLITFLLITPLLAFTPSESAYVLEDGERAVGIGQSMRYGLGNGLELSTHPLLFFIMPNATIKKERGEILGWDWSCRHHVNYPTLAMNIVQKEGIFGLIADDPDINKIPQLLYWHSELLASRSFDRTLITSKVGLALGLGGTDMDKRLWIDYPIAFPRMGVLFNGWGMNVGADLRYTFNNGWDLLIDGDYLTLPGNDYSSFLEHKTLLTWYKSDKIHLSGGYLLTRGEYQSGDQWLIFPLLDVVWNWRK
ncbi:MAG: hypothetical protein H8D46_03035 [FCB group bacterium]|nr:hypothetical protein [FCB group bacterium]